jgi:hypothetical protein
MRLGTHATLSGGSSLRSPTCARTSFRKRAQSDRSSSETNSPGSSGSEEGHDSALLGPEFTPHLPVETVETPVVEPQTPHAWALRRRRAGDSTLLGPVRNHSNGGACGKSSERARTSRANFCAATRRVRSGSTSRAVASATSRFPCSSARRKTVRCMALRGRRSSSRGRDGVASLSAASQ